MSECSEHGADSCCKFSCLSFAKGFSGHSALVHRSSLRTCISLVCTRLTILLLRSCCSFAVLHQLRGHLRIGNVRILTGFVLRDMHAFFGRYTPSKQLSACHTLQDKQCARSYRPASWKRRFTLVGVEKTRQSWCYIVWGGEMDYVV